jgi:hypothetical protein
MRGRAVHRVYAEDEPAAVSYGERTAVPPDDPGVSYDTQPVESQELPTVSQEYPHAQPPWRVRPRGRVLAMALLGAVIAFVVAFSVHALTTPAHVAGQDAGGRAEPPMPPARLPRRVAVTHRRRKPHRVLHKPTAKHSTPPVALRDEEHVAVRLSTGSAPPATPERGATYEFTFER